MRKPERHEHGNELRKLSHKRATIRLCQNYLQFHHQVHGYVCNPEAGCSNPRLLIYTKLSFLLYPKPRPDKSFLGSYK